MDQFEEVQESVQNTAHHLYNEDGGIQALPRGELLVRLETMAQQMVLLQEQVANQSIQLQKVSSHQFEVDQQVEQLVQLLSNQPQQAPVVPTVAQPSQLLQQPVQQLLLQPQQPPVLLPQQLTQWQLPPPPQHDQAPTMQDQGLRLDSAKPPSSFQRNQGEDIEAWILGMKLYFAANPLIPDQKKTIRVALNLSGNAQWRFYNFQRTSQQSIESILLEVLLQELRQAIQLPNRAQTARRQLRNIHHLVPVDTYVSLFKQALYAFEDVSQADALDRFIGNLKNDTKLYIEECQPQNLNHAIALAQSYDATRYPSIPRGKGRSRFNPRGQFGNNGGRYDGSNGGYNAGYNGGYRGNSGRSHRRSGRNSWQGRSGQNGHGRGHNGQVTCYRCGQPRHVAPDCLAQTPQQRPTSPSKIA